MRPETKVWASLAADIEKARQPVNAAKISGQAALSRARVCDAALRQ
jgi:hypothetical protein